MGRLYKKYIPKIWTSDITSEIHKIVRMAIIIERWEDSGFLLFLLTMVFSLLVGAFAFITSYEYLKRPQWWDC